MAKTLTPEGKLSLEAKLGLGVSALVLAACGYLGLREVSRSSDSPDSDATPSIGMITRDIPNLAPLLSQQLDVVSQISGRPDCRPQIITVSDDTNAEVAGICRVGSGETEGTFMVTRKAKGSDQQVINQDLVGYPQRDEKGNVWAIVLAYKDGSPDDGVKPLMWVYPDGLEYVFENNVRVKFGQDEAKNLKVNFADWLKKALEPSVAEAEENPTATATPRPSATWTPRPTPSLTPTDELTPTPTQTEAVNTLRPDFSLDLAGVVNKEGVSLNIPFTIGLMKDIRERSLEPIKSFYVNPERPDTPDKLAYYYLRMCWLNHKKNYPEHADISWTEYLSEVQAGRGLIKLALADSSTSSWDSPKKTVYSAKEISPLDGITLIEADSLFGMKKLAGLYAVENNDRLIVVAHGLFPESFTEPPGKIQRSADFIAGGILPDIYLILGVDINQALEYGYVGNTLNSLDLDFFNEYLKFMPDFYNYSNGSLSTPYFIIEQ